MCSIDIKQYGPHDKNIRKFPSRNRIRISGKILTQLSRQIQTHLSAIFVEITYLVYCNAQTSYCILRALL